MADIYAVSQDRADGLVRTELVERGMAEATLTQGWRIATDKETSDAIDKYTHNPRALAYLRELVKLREMSPAEKAMIDERNARQAALKASTVRGPHPELFPQVELPKKSGRKSTGTSVSGYHQAFPVGPVNPHGEEGEVEVVVPAVSELVEAPSISGLKATGWYPITRPFGSSKKVEGLPQSRGRPWASLTKIVK